MLKRRRRTEDKHCRSRCKRCGQPMSQVRLFPPDRFQTTITRAIDHQRHKQLSKQASYYNHHGCDKTILFCVLALQLLLCQRVSGKAVPVDDYDTLEQPEESVLALRHNGERLTIGHQDPTNEYRWLVTSHCTLSNNNNNKLKLHGNATLTNVIQITCPEPADRMMIGWSHYGVRQNYKKTTGSCHPQPGDCIMEQTDKIAELCSGRNKCTLNHATQFVHKCSRNSNYLFIAYRCTAAEATESICSSVDLIGTDLYLSSPDFPNEYPANRRCSCHLSTVPRSTMLVEAIVFNTQEESDVVSLIQSGSLQRFAGALPVNSVLLDNSHANSATLQFSSDHDLSTSGFWLSVRSFSQCPLGWQSVGSVCTVIGPGIMTWNEAEDYCNNKGGLMMSWSSDFTLSKRISQWLNLERAESIWIGSRHPEEHRDLSWPVVQFKRLKSDRCVSRFSDGTFSPVDCNSSHTAVCQHAGIRLRHPVTIRCNQKSQNSGQSKAGGLLILDPDGKRVPFPIIPNDFNNHILKKQGFFICLICVCTIIATINLLACLICYKQIIKEKWFSLNKENHKRKTKQQADHNSGTSCGTLVHSMSDVEEVDGATRRSSPSVGSTTCCCYCHGFCRTQQQQQRQQSHRTRRSVVLTASFRQVPNIADTMNHLKRHANGNGNPHLYESIAKNKANLSGVSFQHHQQQRYYPASHRMPGDSDGLCDDHSGLWQQTCDTNTTSTSCYYCCTCMYHCPNCRHLTLVEHQQPDSTGSHTPLPRMPPISIQLANVHPIQSESSGYMSTVPAQDQVVKTDRSQCRGIKNVDQLNKSKSPEP